MKINPALLKLELFCNGIKIDKTCELARDARPVLHMRGGLGSGLEMILPGGLYANVPLEEFFVKDSPYVLFKSNGSYFIKKDDQIISRVKLPPPPGFYSRRTSSGKLMSRIGLMQGTYLGIYSDRMCEFWQMNPRMNCHFCSVGLNVGQNEERDKTVEDVLETVEAARREEKITFVHFNTGFLFGKELDGLEPYIKAVKRNTGLLVGVQCPPCHDFSKYDRLKELGVDHVSFCIEFIDPKIFKDICPGKDKYIGQKKYLEAMRYCGNIFGRGRVSGEIIAGLEPPAGTIKAIEEFAGMGAVSTVCVFRPCLGTDLEHSKPPSAEEMIPVFRRLYEACIEYGIPIGMAPNIKVSLVLLAEEGRYFIEGFSWKFFFPELKLALLKILYRTYFKVRMLIRR